LAKRKTGKGGRTGGTKKRYFKPVLKKHGSISAVAESVVGVTCTAG
jgi:hypothetical protein